MWLTLKLEKGDWTWGDAYYIKDSYYSQSQVKRPEGLIPETEADRLDQLNTNAYLTRQALKRTGIDSFKGINEITKENIPKMNTCKEGSGSLLLENKDKREKLLPDIPVGTTFKGFRKFRE